MKSQVYRMRLCVSGKRIQGKFKQSIIFLTLLSLICQPAFAVAQVVADPNAGANRPRVDATANGLPLVQITDPSAGGVSRNQYTTFNVDPRGVILNNGLSLSLTQQAGYVDANPFLTKGPARIILNEVTGGGSSLLQGYTEVAGNRAEVVIANPNGITCNGCGFINASRGIFTTGTPVFGGSGSLEAFRVTGGNIAIEGMGLNASNIDQVDLISRTVNINAGLWANYLNVVTGGNQVSYTGLSAQPIAGDGSAPAVSLDVSALGGMYANKIRLVGTESGVGVRSYGTLASAGNFELTSEGNIVLAGNTSAGGSLSIASGGDIDLPDSGDLSKPNILYSQGNMMIEAGGQLTNGSTVIADQLTVNARQLTNDGPTAVIATKNTIGTASFFISDSLTNINGAAIFSMGDIVIAGSANRDVNGNYSNYTANLLNQSATIEAGRDISITADAITNQKRVFSAEEIVDPALTEAFTNVSVPIPEGLPVGIKFVSAGYIRATADYDETTKVTQVTEDSPSGRILAGRNMVITANNIDNIYSTIAAGNDLAIDVTGALNNTSRGGFNVLTDDGTQTLIYTYEHKTCRTWGCYSNWPEDPHVIPYYKETITQQTFLPGAATITAGNLLTVSAGTINNKTEGPGTASTTLDSIPNDKTKLPDLSFTMPQNGLFRPADPKHQYLIETNPLFTDLRNFMSSDYMLERLAYDPELTQKRLGDGFYEQRLVLDEITLTTGRRYLDNYASAEDQYKALMDSGVSYAQAYNLKVGVGLTAEQMAQLTSDMVWLVEKEVGGQKVLAPVVYLSNLHDKDLKPSGALIAAHDIYLKSASDLTSSGTIKAGYRNEIFASNIVNLGGVIDAGDITTLTADKDIVNKSGTISGGAVALTAGQDIKNETTTDSVTRGNYAYTNVGRQAVIEARGDLTASAGRDIVLSGSQVKAAGDATLYAGRDLQVSSVEQKEHIAVVFSNGFYEQAGTTNILSSIETGGSLNLIAKNDATFAGAQVQAGADLTLLAGGNVKLSAVKDSALTDVKVEYNKGYVRSRTEDEFAIGTNFIASGNVTIGAVEWGEKDDEDGHQRASGLQDHEQSSRGNVLIEGSSIVSEGGALTIAADSDVTIREVQEYHESLTEAQSVSRAYLSSKKSVSRDFVSQDLAIGSSLSGDIVTIGSGRDLVLQGSTVVGNGDVTLAAENNVTITTARQTVQEEHERSVKRSGLSGYSGDGKIGISYGSDRTRSTSETAIVNNVGSTLGSVFGNVAISAGKDVSIIGSAILSATGTDITAQNVAIEAAYDTMDNKTVDEHKWSGLKLEGGIELSTDLGKMYDSWKRSNEVQGDQLKKLYQVRSAKAGYDYYQSTQQQGDSGIGASVSLAYTSDRSRAVSYTHSETAVGSQLVTDGKLNITATGNSLGEGDITVIGSGLQGKNISLDAARDIVLQSAKNIYDSSSTNGSNSFGIGVKAQVKLKSKKDKDSNGENKDGNYSKGISIYANTSGSEGRTDVYELTHTDSLVMAQENLTIHSGRDTTLRGTQASADKIIADVGRDLSLESEQDASTYQAANRNISGGIQYTWGSGTGVNIAYSRGKTDSDYRSVSSQTGLMAGEGGFDINVKGNTDLKGAVIASKAEESKNRLSTDTLTWSNLENKAEYDASSLGLSISVSTSNSGVKSYGASPIIGLPSEGNDGNTTLASISPGTIEIRSNKDQDLSALSREADSAHQTLGKIFDQQKVAEQQELAKVFGEEAFHLVGDISAAQRKPYQQAEQKQQAAEEYKQLLAIQEKGMLTAEQERQMQSLEADFTLSPQNVDNTIQAAIADQEKFRETYDMWKENGAAKTALTMLVGAAQAGLGGQSALTGALGAGGTAQLIPVMIEAGLTKEEAQLVTVLLGAAAGKVTGGDPVAGAAVAISKLQNNCFGDKTCEEAFRKIIFALKTVAQRVSEDIPIIAEKVSEDVPNAIGQAAEAIPVIAGRVSEDVPYVLKEGALDTVVAMGRATNTAEPFYNFVMSDEMGGFLQWSDENNITPRLEGLSQTAGGFLIGATTPLIAETGVGFIAIPAQLTFAVDQVGTGLTRFWTGERSESQLYQLSANGLNLLDLDPKYAPYVEVGVIGLTGFVNASEMMSLSRNAAGTLEMQGVDQSNSFTQRQMDMLENNTGYNVSPEPWFQQYDKIGRSGTYITDYKAIKDVIGDFKPGSYNLEIQTTLKFEEALGLKPNTLMDGFRITEVSGIKDLNPRSPLQGTNDLFRGPGAGLPGGGSEMVVNPISTGRANGGAK